MSAFAALLGGYFLYLLRGILPPFIMAAFIAFVLEPVVSRLQKKGLSRAKSIFILYGVLFVAFSLITVYFVPKFVRDVRVLAGEIPRFTLTVQGYASKVRETALRYNLPGGLERGIVTFLGLSEDFLDNLGDNAISYCASSATFLSYLIISPVIAYYILRDINRWRRQALVSLARYPAPYMDLVRDVDRVMGGFVRGQSIVALSVWGMVWAAAAALGIKHGAVLGMVSGLGEFVPFFGPLLGAVPALLAALAKSPATMFWMLGAVGVIQWIDANLVVPKVTGPRVGLHPLWIMFSILAGAKLLGVWGLFLAVPLGGISGALVTFIRAMSLARRSATGDDPYNL